LTTSLRVSVEGWTDNDQNSGRAKGDHHRYVFTTPAGDRLFARVSHGSGQYGDPDLFAHILREQLQIDEQQFWAAVDRGLVPVRPVPETVATEGQSIDAKLARNLLSKGNVTPSDLAEMTQDEAVARWNEWLTGDPKR
jgi:hypothetical protein